MLIYLLRPAWFLVLLLVLAAGCYRPQVVQGRPGPATLAGLPGNRWPVVRGLRLHVFNTGENRVSAFLVGSPAPWRPVPAFVLEHPTQGLVVFDTGLGPEIAEHGEGALHPLTRLLFRSRSRPGLGLADQMQAAGFSPAAVRTVILSHLHFDHVGGLERFPDATFVVGRGERPAARSRLRGFAPRHTDWVAADAWKEIDFRAAPPYATFDHAVDLFGDHSVMLVQGGGHTRGGLGALLALPGGPALLAGDLVVHWEWLASDDVQRIVVNPQRAADVRNRIRRLVELAPQLLVFPGHDLSRVPGDRPDIVRHHPELFQPEAWPLD